MNSSFHKMVDISHPKSPHIPIVISHVHIEYLGSGDVVRIKTNFSFIDSAIKFRSYLYLLHRFNSVYINLNMGIILRVTIATISCVTIARMLCVTIARMLSVINYRSNCISVITRAIFNT